MTSLLRIILAQINPIVGDLGYNQDKILVAWEKANSDLVIFPELALCGYPPEDLALRQAFLDEIEKAIQGILQKSKAYAAAALIGCPWRHEGKIHNAVHLIERGEIAATRYKHHLPNYGVFDEMRIFQAGPLPEPIVFRGHKLGAMICEDMWSPDVSAHLKAQGAEILIVVNASPYDFVNKQRRYEQARARTRETALPLVYVNQVGGQDEIVFDGGSFAMAAEGEILIQSPFYEESFDLYPSPDRAKAWEGEGLLADIYAALCLGLSDYIRKNNFPGVLLGLSGGVDSALTAAIAADALGRENVHAVMMPSCFTSRESLDDAAAVAKNLNIKLETISIENVVKECETTLKPALSKDAPGTTFENLQSRARGIILMALSNATGKMVLSTGNKSEMAVGYATLYGDMCGGFNVLKDVYKTQVYALCRWRNQQGMVIPERVLTKAPTAELKANQTDQDTLPPYDVLDKILHGLIEEDLGINDLAAREHDKALIHKVWRMLDAAEYKRRQAPPGVKISPRAFGRERRVPMTNNFLKNVEK